MRFSDGSVLQLYPQTIQEFDLYPGRELSDRDMHKLLTAVGAMSAKMRAVRILAATSVSKKDLEHRLVQKGEDPNQAQEAVTWLSKMDLLDDKKTGEQIVQRCVTKGYGVQRVKQMLYEKRIPKEYWDEILEGYPAQREKIEEFIRDRLGDSRDPKELRRVTDALIRRGHSYGEIRQVFATLNFESDDLPEE